MAKPEPNESPSNKRRDLVTEFRDEYEKALADAIVSAEHTATEGWQRLYGSERSQEQQITRQLCKDLEAAAAQLQMVGPTEDGEKEIGEIKKRATALRERREAFDLHAVAPVREPVDRCEKVIENYRAKARGEEADAPLHNVGLEHLMIDAIAGVRRVKWNEESGRVEFIDPGQARD